MEFNMNQLKVKTDTIIRTLILALALINQILTGTGHSPLPISDEDVTEIISLCVTIGASVWAWWKNNSFTQAALRADETMRAEKELGL